MVGWGVIQYRPPNRGICEGDAERSGVGNHNENVETIRRTIARWSTPNLKKFLKTCRSALWRKEVYELVLVRECITQDLSNLSAKRKMRKDRIRRERAS